MRWAILAGSILALFLIGQPRAGDDIDDVADAVRRDLTLAVSTARVFTPDRPVIDVFIANPNVADVAASSPDTIYIYGKAPGRTTIVGYGQDGEIHSLINLRVTHDLGEIEKAIAIVAPSADVALESTPSGILINGVARSSKDEDTIVRTVTHFAGSAEARILNNMVIDMPSQVNLRVRIAEIERSAGETLQFDWSAGYRIDGRTGGNFAIGRDFFNRQFTSSGQRAQVEGNIPRYTRGADPFSGSTLDSFLIGRVMPGINMIAVLDALEAENVATVLAEPNLTAISGETANFLAGGEFPVPVSGTLGQVNVTFKSYGVSLSFTPTVIDDGRISLRLLSEVSELSGTSTTRVNDVSIPGLSTRRAETVVELASGESFAIAGLIRNNVRSRLQQFPGLGDVPILGALFRSESFQRNQSELVVIVTPYIVQPVRRADRLSTPLDDMVLTGRLERMFFGKMTKDTRALDAVESAESSPESSPESSRIEPSSTPLRPLGGFMME